MKKIVSLLKKAPRLQVIQSEVIPVRAHTSVKELCDTFRDLLGGI